MPKRRRFTIVLVPHNDANVREIGGPFVVVCGVFLLLLVGLGLWGVSSTYLTSLFGGSKLAKLESENKLLTTRLNELGRLRDTFTDQMTALVKREQELRVVVGLPDIPSDIRKVGVGGPADRTASSEKPASAASLSAPIKADIDRLLREARLELASLKEIQGKAEKDRAYWNHVPTVKPVRGVYSSGFGVRQDPFTGLHRMHQGVDLAARPGEPVRATADGVVIATGLDINYGRYIDVDHQNGLRTRFGHLSSISVERGAYIKRGDVIGRVGNTGRSMGYHLHYEVRKNGRLVNPNLHFWPEDVVVD
ncbi:MAG: M23 family metallopeptidase [Candidatus Latescibacteria bacterium]|nr:M23 family metallopeptidase [Candidatus Latescibacterota bacterium]